MRREYYGVLKMAKIACNMHGCDLELDSWGEYYCPQCATLAIRKSMEQIRSNDWLR